MLLGLLRGQDFDIVSLIIRISSVAFVVFCTAPVHEFAHAFVAYKLGDDTARLKGRLTINPFAHINWIGALMILLVGFGYAQPVPVNIRNVRMKNKNLAMALIALAGPVSNLIMAFVAMFLMIISSKYIGTSTTIGYTLNIFLFFITSININLAVFNLLPVPPLDGSRILFAVLPAKYYFAVMKYERYISLGIMFLLLTGILTKPLQYLAELVYDLFALFFSLIF